VNCSLFLQASLVFQLSWHPIQQAKTRRGTMTMRRRRRNCPCPSSGGGSRPCITKSIGWHKYSYINLSFFCIMPTPYFVECMKPLHEIMQNSLSLLPTNKSNSHLGHPYAIRFFLLQWWWTWKMQVPATIKLKFFPTTTRLIKNNLQYQRYICMSSEE